MFQRNPFVLLIPDDQRDQEYKEYKKGQIESRAAQLVPILRHDGQKKQNREKLKCIPVVAKKSETDKDSREWPEERDFCSSLNREPGGVKCGGPEKQGGALWCHRY